MLDCQRINSCCFQAPPYAVSTGCTGSRTLACALAVSECSRKPLHGFLALRDPVPRRRPAGRPLSSPPALLCPQRWHVVTSALTSPPDLLTQHRGPPWPLLVGSITGRGWCFSRGLCAEFKPTLLAWEQHRWLGLPGQILPVSVSVEDMGGGGLRTWGTGRGTGRQHDRVAGHEGHGLRVG